MTIAVLTPSYGYGRFIGDALETVRMQGSGVHHVVQDAQSSDETLDLLRDSSADWSSEPDRGQSDALNRALRRSSADWIGWLNADEFYLPGALARLRSAGERAGADVVYGDVVFVDGEGRMIRLLPQHHFSRLALRWYGSYISNCAALFRRTALPPDPWDDQLSSIMDWDLYLGLSSRGARFLHVPYPMAAFRVHPGQVTSSDWTTFEAEYRRLEERHGVPPPRVRMVFGRILHGMLKLTSGARSRQKRAAPFAGRDMRWFLGPAQAQNLEELLEAAYPTR